MQIPTLLTLAGLMVLAGQPEGVPEILSGCQVPDEGPGSYSLLCAGSSLLVKERPSGDYLKVAEGATSAFLDMAPKPVVQSALELQVGESKVPGTRLRDGSGKVFLVMSGVRGSMQSFASCSSAESSEAICRGLLATVWAWKPGDRPPASIPRNLEKTLAGRRISPPDGCLANGTGGSGMFSCGDTSFLVWVTLPSDRKGVMDGWLRSYPETEFVVRVEPCVVEGVPTDCHVVRNPKGGPPAATAADVMVRGVRIFVACADLRENPGLAPVCGLVMSLPPPLPAATGETPAQK